MTLSYHIRMAGVKFFVGSEVCADLPGKGLKFRPSPLEDRDRFERCGDKEKVSKN